MKRYILKEYGSWGVLLLSYLAGLIAAGTVTRESITALAAIAFLVNSKQPLTLLLRAKGRDAILPGTVFVGHVVFASVLLLLLFREHLVDLLPFTLVPFVYIVLLVLAGEHALYTEVSGFLTLCLSSLVAVLAATGNVDGRVYAGTAVFFTAGVFKVRVQFRKGMRERTTMVVYLIMACAAYALIGIDLALLLPLLDNLVFALFLYRTTLTVTGWLEVAKGVSFLVLMALRYV